MFSKRRVLPIACLIIAGLVVSCGGNGASNKNTSSSTTNSVLPENKKSQEPSPTTSTSENKQPIRITAPADNEQVVELPFVEGTVSDSAAKVFVIVRPMEVSDYWVQPPVTIREGGKWKVQIHIGRPGAVDVGKHFEIMAVVASPKSSLKEGDKLKEWPEAKWKSQVIEVIRK